MKTDKQKFLKIKVFTLKFYRNIKIKILFVNIKRGHHCNKYQIISIIFFILHKLINNITLYYQIKN